MKIMEVNDIINSFLDKRPECMVAIGYGSGVIKQNGYDKCNKPQIDILIGVKDTSKWHLENMKLNPNDYSKKGMKYFKKSSKFIDYYTNINFLPYIEYESFKIKLGIFSFDKIIKDLIKGESYYLSGRLSKPNLIIKHNGEFEKAMKENRKMALWVGACLQEKNGLVRDLYINIAKFSYLGDIRNGIKIFKKEFFKHENPHKISNLVDGSYLQFDNIYRNIENDFLEFNNDEVLINVDNLLNCSKDFLPMNLYSKLERFIKVKDYTKIKELLIKYFSKKNRRSSIIQALKGALTTDFKKTREYLKEKEKKAKL